MSEHNSSTPAFPPKPTHHRFKDIEGRVFGRLTVIRFAGQRPGNGAALWLCRCECGTEKVIGSGHLIIGAITSCGCIKKENNVARSTHGGTHTRLFGIWEGMRRRCRNPNERSYKDYGARGIGIDPAWDDFAAFREWAMANGYRDDLTIERRDVNLGYSPENCTWIPHADQSSNRTNTRYIEAFGETKTFRRWSEDPRCVVRMATLINRIDAYGWPAEKALTTPVRRH